MPVVKIEIKGVSAELVLGNYMPDDPTIYNDWQEFFHYNDLIHESQLLSDYITEITIYENDKLIFHKKNDSFLKIEPRKSFCPAMEQDKLYLRTECVENAVYQAEFETDAFDVSKLSFETQDYDLLFKVGKSFITGLLYDGRKVELNWDSGATIGNLCVLCKFDKGYLIPVYDAIRKEQPKNIK